MKTKWFLITTLLLGSSAFGQQVPSPDARRLWFVAATSGDDAMLASYLRTAGVIEPVAVKVLREFRSRLQKQSHTLAEVNRLVQDTVSELSLTVATDSLSNLEQHVAREAVHIHVEMKKHANGHMHPGVMAVKYRGKAALTPVQFGCDMSGMVDAYNSGAYDANTKLDGQPHKFYLTVVTESLGDGNCFASHTLYATNNLNGANTFEGTVSASDYETVSNVQSTLLPGGCFASPQSGCPRINTSGGGEGDCNVDGTLYQQQWYDDLESAIVTDVVTSHAPGSIVWNVKEWCLPQYAPPDLNPNQIIWVSNGTNPPDSTKFIESLGWCLSAPFLPHGWHCTIMPAFGQGRSTSEDLQFCTKNPPPY